MVRNKIGLHFSLLFLFSLITFLAIVFVISSLGQCEGVTFSKTSVTPSSGDEDSEYVFKVRVTSSEEPEDPLQIVIEGIAYDLREVDTNDQNFSNGKEFFYSDSFGPGPKFYYYRCGGSTTRVLTFNVKDSGLFQEVHPDLLFAMLIYILPLLYFILLLRKVNRHIGVIIGAVPAIEYRSESSSDGVEPLFDSSEKTNDQVNDDKIHSAEHTDTGGDSGSDEGGME